jgi:hypothetical protein
MKQFSILILFILVTACGGTKNVIEKTESIKKIEEKVIEITEVKKR